ncbi:MAG: DUF1573 domain-containing protein [Deltaproteobacteria bacterium]|nr:DUF1573 domain-containing protein [Deltaproteobacteria bacterium]
MVRKIVGIFAVILVVFLFFADYSMAETPDKPQVVSSERSQNVEPASQNGPAPRISSTEALYDFGEVNEGERVEHVFQIQNTGSADLVLKSATGS